MSQDISKILLSISFFFVLGLENEKQFMYTDSSQHEFFSGELSLSLDNNWIVEKKQNNQVTIYNKDAKEKRFFNNITIRRFAESQYIDELSIKSYKKNIEKNFTKKMPLDKNYQIVDSFVYQLNHEKSLSFSFYYFRINTSFKILCFTY